MWLISSYFLFLFTQFEGSFWRTFKIYQEPFSAKKSFSFSIFFCCLEIDVMNFIYAVKCFSSDVIILISTENNQNFFLFPFPQNFCKFWNESTKLYGTRALVPYVSRAPLVLVLHVPRLLRALVLHVPLALRPPMTYASCLTFSCASRVLCFTCSRTSHVLRDLLPHMSCALRVLVLLVPRTPRSLVFLIPPLLQVFQA